jgi:hypothetical protein
MPVVSFTNRDLLRGKVVEPAWYRVKILTVGEAPAATQPGKTPSTNYPVEGTILFNGDTGDTKFANVPLDWNFNSKAIGFAVGFLQAFGVDIKEGQRIELKSAEERELDIFVENDTWQGRTVNRVNHKYRAPRTEVTAVSQG